MTWLSDESIFSEAFNKAPEDIHLVTACITGQYTVTVQYMAAIILDLNKLAIL